MRPSLEPRSSAYVGAELPLFALAERWKSYWGAQIAPFLGRTVLEVGAGMGANTLALQRRFEGQAWTCLEPDARLAGRIRSRVSSGELPPNVQVLEGTLKDVSEREGFDTILYLDVLEHVADDAGEVAGAVRRLTPRGHLVVLSPAHQALFSPFDASIGHHRRYDRSSLLALKPPGSSVERTRYLDSAGMLLSLGNRLVSRQALPTRGQILLWDRFLVPVSCVLDRVTAFRVGKSILFVLRKNG